MKEVTILNEIKERSMSINMEDQEKIDGRTLRAQRTHASVHAKILLALRDLAAEGANDLTPTRIAARAGVSATTIYNHFPGSTGQILDEMIDEIFAGAAASAQPFVDSGEPLEATRAVMRTFAVELVKLGPGGKVALSHHYESLAKAEKQREMFEDFVYPIVSREGGLDDRLALKFTRHLGIIVRGLHSTWANFPISRVDDQFAISDEEFVDLHLHSVDHAMMLAKSK